MPRGRIRVSQPVTVTGGSTGGGTTAAPTGTWGEDATVGDDLAVRSALTEDATVADDLRVASTLTEDATVDDAFRAIIAGAYAEDATVNDLVRVNVVIQSTPTATPDADLFGDYWADQASPGTTRPTASPLQAKQTLPASSNAREGFIKIDLTRFAGFVADATAAFAMRIALTGNTTSAVGDSVGWAVFRQVASPFTESTANYTNRPTGGTSVRTGTQALAGATDTPFNIDLTAAQLDPALGGWLYIRLTGGDATGVLTVNVYSRDDATASRRPSVPLNLLRGT
jgi:hypothetical protein